MRLNGKKLQLVRLAQEMKVAGVVIDALGTSGIPADDPNGEIVFTYTVEGEPTELPPEAVPVIAAHDPSPLAWVVTPDPCAANATCTATVTVPTSFCEAAVSFQAGTADPVSIAVSAGQAAYHFTSTIPATIILTVSTVYYGSLSQAVTFQ